MAAEIKSNKDAVRWPEGIRLPVMLTFEHQAGEGAPLFAGEPPTYMVGGAMQYGARRGIWNIVELLEKYRVKATFCVLGTTATKTTNQEDLDETYQTFIKVWERVPYVSTAGVQSVLNFTRHAGAKAAKPEQFIDNSLLSELEKTGYVSQLYGR